MPRSDDALSDELREIAHSTADQRYTRPLHSLADRVEDLERLADAMQDFIEAEYRADFEDTLDYDMQEMYRSHFGLSHAILSEDEDEEEDDEFAIDEM
jgi:hypothetical protein